MSDSEWSNIRSKVSNLVLQLNVISGVYNPLRPYAKPRDTSSSGSGFLVDHQKGYVVTNAHVVDNAMSVWGSSPKTGKTKLGMKVVSIIRDKDLALLQLEKDSLEKLMNGEDRKSMEIKFGDSLKVKETDNIMIVGYHLGQRQPSFTTGVVSTFHTEDTGFGFSTVEDAYSRDTTYMTTTAPMNPGVSGSPLFNQRGEAIGVNAAGRIFANGIGYAISSRVLMSVLPIMIKEIEPSIPTMSLRWSPTDQSTRKFLMGSSGEDREGIMVRSVHPDSILHKLQNKDIIEQISFKMSLDGEFYSVRDITDNNSKKIPVTGVFDSLGDITLIEGPPLKNRKDLDKSKKIVNRKIPISELADLIPVGSEVDVVFNRGNSRKVLSTENKYVETSRIYGVYPVYRPFEYRFVGGLVVTPLLLNQAAMLGMTELTDDMDSDSFLFNNHLVVVQVFPETSVSETGAVNAGDILVEVNDQPVSTMKELDKALKNSIRGNTTFLFSSGSFIAVDNKKMKSDENVSKELAGES